MTLVNQVFGNGYPLKDAENVFPALCSKEALPALDLGKNIDLKLAEMLGNNSELVDVTPLLARAQGITIFQGGNQHVVLSNGNITVRDLTADSSAITYSDTDGDGTIDGISVLQDIPDVKFVPAGQDPMVTEPEEFDPTKELPPDTIPPFIE